MSRCAAAIASSASWTLGLSASASSLATRASDAIGFGRRRGVGDAGRGGVDAVPLADGAEGGAVRRRIGIAERFGDELVRHLVLEHLDDCAPRAVDDEGARQLDAAIAGEPLAELVRAVGERQRRGAQAALEVAVVERAPGREQLTQQRRFERRRQSVVVHRDQCRRRAIVTPQNLGRDLAKRDERGGVHAGEGNDRARQGRQARRQIGVDAGGRVRAPGDPSHSRGQARREEYEAGDRDRACRGAARGREAGRGKSRRRSVSCRRGA